MTTITEFPNPPSRSSSPDTFEDEADAFFAQFAVFVPEANVAIAEIETNSVAAVNAAATATTKATEAANSATTATSAATTASTQATNASTSASNAATSEANAANSAAAAVATPVAAPTHAAANKATPVDADEFPLVDSAAAWALKKFTWANIKAALKNYFDTLYPAIGASVPVRQTVLSGPVDSNGLPSFGGSTGSTTVTASGTLKATAAAGGDANYTGSITNPAWTGLSTNGTMYLYLDITSGGIVTTGSTALAPVYQWGGAYSTTSGQATFNIQDMTMKVGNGSSAAQVTRVFVGEVTVAGGVVSAITWYALMGRYIGALATGSGFGNNVRNVFSHNIGTKECDVSICIENVTTDQGWATGERTVPMFTNASVGYVFPLSGEATDRVSASVVTGGGALRVQPKAGGDPQNATAANWKLILTAQRRF